MTHIHVSAPTYVYVLEELYEGYDYTSGDILGVFTSKEAAQQYGNDYQQTELEWKPYGNSESWVKAYIGKDESLYVSRHQLDPGCPRVICGTA